MGLFCSMCVKSYVLDLSKKQIVLHLGICFINTSCHLVLASKIHFYKT
jgi:hypothetical protein